MATKILINTLNLSPESEQILNRLKSRGWKIICYIESALQGNASSNFEEQKISFRDQRFSKDSGIVFHELLHFDLYDKGYPTITSKFGNTYSIFMLNDVFQHIIMNPEIVKTGSSIKEHEEPATLKLITDLVCPHPKLTEDEELFSAILYIRAHFLEIEEAMVAPLKEHIQKNNKRLKMSQILEAINRFPKPDCSINEYTECLNNVLFALDLKNEVIVKKP